MSDQPPKKSSTKPLTEKSTGALVAERVKEVQGWILFGRPRHQIVTMGVKQWQLSDRQIDTYIAKATEQIREVNAHNLEESLSVVLANFWLIYRRSMNAGDLDLAMRTMEKIAKFKGLEKHTLVIKDEREFEDLTDEELDKMLEGVGDDTRRDS